MIKLLLIGFSKQNVKPLSVYCQRKLPQFECVFVDRQLTNNMKLTLPTLTREQAACDAFMIFLDGVGMTVFNQQHLIPLVTFIGAKPTILVSRRQSEKWQSSLPLSTNHILYIDAPYTVHIIQDSFEKLAKIIASSENIDNAHLADANSNIDSYQHKGKRQAQSAVSSTTKETLDTSIEEIGLNELYESVANNSKTRVMDKVLSTYFPKLHEQSLPINSLFIWSQIQPLKVTAGAHSFYVNTIERRAVVRQDISRLIESIGVVGRYLFSSTMNLRIDKISMTSYEKMTENLLQSGYQNYSLHTLMWQLADAALEPEFEYSEHNLRMKVLTLPNFTIVEGVADYVYPVLAACLSKPRSLQQLQKLFPDLSFMILNRILVVSLIAGILDTSALCDEQISQITVAKRALTNDTDIDDDSNSHVKEEINGAVQKARRSGFFRRLLQKLSL